jgi:hypothetical protein
MEIKILRGCSGSGKSTYIAKNFPGAYVVSSDHYFMVDVGHGQERYVFDPMKLGESHGQCLRFFIEECQEMAGQFGAKVGPDAVLAVDNTNTQVAELAPYAAIAAAYKIPFEIITLDVDPKVAAARNTHGVPLRSVERQYSRMLAETSRIPSHWPKRTITFTEITPGKD